jgi:DNA-binding transcriptional ArsR family regulator
LYIIRKTFGFNKIRGDKIPFSQITKAIGLSRQSALEAIKVLEGCNLIKVVRGREKDGSRSINYYQLTTRIDYNKFAKKW